MYYTTSTEILHLLNDGINDFLIGGKAADRTTTACFSPAGKQSRLRSRLRFTPFLVLNAKCVRCKGSGPAVLMFAFCVILRLRLAFAFEAVSVIHSFLRMPSAGMFLSGVCLSTSPCRECEPFENARSKNYFYYTYYKYTIFLW